MKWITHQSIALASGVLLSFSPTTLFGVLVGSVLPDSIDHFLARCTPCPEKTFKRIHRGISHWYGSYLLAFIICFSALQGMNALESWGFLSKKALYFQWGLGISFGALMHILLDMCTPSGVPMLPFIGKSRFSLKLFATGSLHEYAFLVLAMICFTYYAMAIDPKALRLLEQMGYDLGRVVQDFSKNIL